MAKIEFEIADSSPCFDCHTAVDLSNPICPSCGNHVGMRFTIKDLIYNFLGGHIIDVRAGGLVLGRHDAEDDIAMILQVAPGVFQLIGAMQGGEEQKMGMMSGMPGMSPEMTPQDPMQLMQQPNAVPPA